MHFVSIIIHVHVHVYNSHTITHAHVDMCYTHVHVFYYFCYYQRILKAQKQVFEAHYTGKGLTNVRVGKC